MMTRRRVYFYLLSFFLLSYAGFSNAGIADYYANSFTTKATWYQSASPNDGECSIIDSSEVYSAVDYSVAVIKGGNEGIYDGSAICGMCMEVTYLNTGSGSDPPPASFTTVVADSCPSCDNPYQIDLRQNTQLDGLWDVSWTAIPCPMGNTKIGLTCENCQEFYIKIQVVDALYPISAVRVDSKDGVRSSDNHFEFINMGQFNPANLVVEVISYSGESVTVTLSTSFSALNSGIVRTDQQFTARDQGSQANTANTLRSPLF